MRKSRKVMTQAEILKEIHRVDGEWQKAHTRNGQRCDDLENEVRALIRNVAEGRDIITKIDALVGELGRRKTDWESVRFPPRLLIGTAGGVIGALIFLGSVLLGQWNATSHLSSDVQAVASTIQLQKAALDARSALEDDRAQRMAKDLSDLKAQVTLQDMKMTNLRETVLSKVK